MNEPADLPEGAILELVAIDADVLDELDEAERDQLRAALDEGIAQSNAEDTVDAGEALDALRARAAIR